MGENPDQVLDPKYYPPIFRWYEVSHIRKGDIKALYRFWMDRQTYGLDPLHFLGAKVSIAPTSEQLDRESAFQSKYLLQLENTAVKPKVNKEESEDENEDDDEDEEEADIEDDENPEAVNRDVSLYLFNF
jgi:TATA-binding protein-associated factor Taf7